MPPNNVPARPNSSARRVQAKRGVKRTSADTIVQSESKDPDTGFSSNARATSTHVYFWGGILSNWWLQSPLFSGATGLEHVLPKLDSLKVPHPPQNALSTQILAAHQFVCGEQWMMAIKAWLFERTSRLGEMSVSTDRNDVSDDSVIAQDQFEALRRMVMQPMPPEDTTFDEDRNALYEGTLYAILRATTPRTQKALGRKVSGFDDEVWTKASTSIVVASCIARAEVDPALRQVYQDAMTKKFVEGSPVDRIWGVGLKWDNPQINNESNWRGQNRLGLCHDEAARYIRGKFNA